jgi:hypothetical protein
MPAAECRLDEQCLSAYSSVHYLPTIPGNAVFLAIFALVLIGQVWLGIKFKSWGYMAAMIGGVVLEIVGYQARISMNIDPFDGKTARALADHETNAAKATTSPSTLSV